MKNTTKHIFQVSFITVPLIGGLMSGRGQISEACNSFSDYCDIFDESENFQASLDSSNSKWKSNQLINYTVVSYNRVRHDFRQKRSGDPFLEAKKTSNRVSTLLDELLVDSGYDKKMRPEVEGKPIQVSEFKDELYYMKKKSDYIPPLVSLYDIILLYTPQVKVNIAIRSMGPVDENSQTFQLDCYFRQYWEDFRLKFNVTGLSELPMNWQFLTDIWRPDTIIINGIDSYLHKITVNIKCDLNIVQSTELIKVILE